MMTNRKRRMRSRGRRRTSATIAPLQFLSLEPRQLLAADLLPTNFQLGGLNSGVLNLGDVVSVGVGKVESQTSDCKHQDGTDDSDSCQEVELKPEDAFFDSAGMVLFPSMVGFPSMVEVPSRLGVGDGGGEWLFNGQNPKQNQQYSEAPTPTIDLIPKPVEQPIVSEVELGQAPISFLTMQTDMMIGIAEIQPSVSGQTYFSSLPESYNEPQTVGASLSLVTGQLESYQNFALIDSMGVAGISDSTPVVASSLRNTIEPSKAVSLSLDESISRQNSIRKSAQLDAYFLNRSTTRRLAVGTTAVAANNGLKIGEEFESDLVLVDHVFENEQAEAAMQLAMENSELRVDSVQASTLFLVVWMLNSQTAKAGSFRTATRKSSANRKHSKTYERWFR